MASVVGGTVVGLTVVGLTVVGATVVGVAVGGDGVAPDWPPPPSHAATIAAIGTPDGSGKVTVSVVVPSSQAAELAARSASGRVALVLDSRER